MGTGIDMKLIVLLFFIILADYAHSACSTPVSRGGTFSSGTTISSSAMNTQFNTLYTHVNNIDGDCIQDTSLNKSKLEAGYKDTTVTSVSGSYTTLSTDEVILASAGSAFTITLPTAVGITGRTYNFKKTDSSVNQVTIDANGAETIDGVLTRTLNAQYDTLIISSNGATWSILGGTSLNARVAGESYFAGTASCNWARTSATIGAFTTVAACPGPTVVTSSLGTWATTDSDLPRQTITDLPSGKYKAKFQVALISASGSNSALAINDGTTTCEAVRGNDGSAANQGQFIECTFIYTSAGTRTFELYAASAASTITATNSTTDPRVSTKFILEYMGQ